MLLFDAPANHAGRVAAQIAQSRKKRCNDRGGKVIKMEIAMVTHRPAVITHVMKPLAQKKDSLG